MLLFVVAPSSWSFVPLWEIMSELCFLSCWQHGITPVALAAQEGHKSIVAMFLARGAGPPPAQVSWTWWLGRANDNKGATLG
jgi:hypothetical protein